MSIEGAGRWSMLPKHEAPLNCSPAFSLTTSPKVMEMRFPPKNLCQTIFSKVAVGHHLSLSVKGKLFLGDSCYACTAGLWRWSPHTETMGPHSHTHTLHTFVYVELWRALDCTAVQPADEVCC